MGDEAKIKVGVEGEAEAERKLKKLTDGFKSWGRELGGVVAGMVTGLGSMSMTLAHVDPGTAAQKFRDFRRTVTEQAIASGRSINDLKGQFAQLSDRTLLPDDQVADFSATLAKATYDFGDSRKALEALRGSGVATGRSLEDMGGVAETLHNSMGVSFGDMPELMGRIEASAKALGTTGGPAALMDDLQALNSMLSQVSVTGKRSAGDLVGVLAAIGKGHNVEQAKAVQAGLIGRFTSGGEQMRLNLGIKREDFYDQNGNVRVNAQNVERLKNFYLKRAGGNADKAQSLAAFSGNLGPQLAAALFRPGLIEDMKKSATAAAPGTGDAALAALRASQHGVEAGKQNARDRETRENVGAKANAAQQAAANLMPENSALRMLVTGIGGGMASAITQTLVTGAFGQAAKKAAESLFSVAVSGDKARLVLGGASSAATGAGVPLATAGGAALGGAAVPALGLAAVALHDQALDSVSEGMQKGLDQMKSDLASGRKRQVKHWYNFGGSSLEDVPAGEQASEAAKYAAANHLPPPEVKIIIEDASGHPNQVVQVQKGSSGRQ